MNLLALFGLLAGAIAVLDTVPYVRDILRGQTRPHRGTWLIWGVLATVAFFSQLADGASWSLGMVGGQAVVMLLVFALSLPYGMGSAGRHELLLMAAAACGVAGWLVISEPLVATVSVVLADFIGVVLMLPKTYRTPDSETLSTFALAGVSGVFGSLAVGEWELSLLLYPVYFAVMNTFIAALIVVRRSALRGRVTAVPAA